MSKGLGTLQREILAAIDAGLGAPLYSRVPVPKGAFERSSLRWNMARARGQSHGNTPETRAFSAAFSRAFKGLTQHGFIEPSPQETGDYYRKTKAVKR